MITKLKRLFGYMILLALFIIFVVLPTFSIMGFTGNLLDQMVNKFVEARNKPPPMLR